MSARAAGKGTIAVRGGERGHPSYEGSTQVRGMKTLALRVERQNACAMTIARWLASHPGVERVNCPRLESHPQHAIGPPAVAIHVERTEEERRLAGIPEGLVRCSFGIEDVEDLIDDLDRALASLA